MLKHSHLGHKPLSSSLDSLPSKASLVRLTRDSFETSFLRKIGLPKNNLIIYQSILAKKTIFDDNKIAKAVETSEMSEASFSSSPPNKKIIVSAGSFQSPQLLVVSGVGPTTTLQKRAPLSSRTFLTVNVLTTSALGSPVFSAQPNDLFHSNPPRGMLTNTGADILGFEKIRPSLHANLSATTNSDLARVPADWPELEHIPTSAYYGYHN
ncbi:MAG: hypothetical protein Q9182_002200 [Xanthomendoza sp. 2 TL-2023]